MPVPKRGEVPRQRRWVLLWVLRMEREWEQGQELSKQWVQRVPVLWRQGPEHCYCQWALEPGERLGLVPTQVPWLRVRVQPWVRVPIWVLVERVPPVQVAAEGPAQQCGRVQQLWERV